MITYRVPARSAQANQPHEIRILYIVVKTAPRRLTHNRLIPNLVVKPL